MTTDRSVGKDRKRRGENQLRRHSRTGNLPRTAAIGQIVEGMTIGLFTIISESPVRNKSTNQLEWRVACPQGHVQILAHSSLSFNVVPTNCAQCVKEDQEQAAAQKVKARRVLAECLSDARAARIAKFEKQQEGI